MPNLTAHLGMARDAASRIDHPTISNNIGALLLGSVAPDIRIVTKASRDDTHFVALDFQSSGDGLSTMFREYPHLGKHGDNSDATQAFIIGYASHLFADENWILDFYRPYFGNRKVFSSPEYGDLMDRALQLELDRKEGAGMGGMEILHPMLACAENDVNIDFIPSDVMAEWRRWVQGTLDWEFSWERLRFMARRIMSRNSHYSQERMDFFLQQFLLTNTNGIESVYEFVPQSDLDVYRQKIMDFVSEFAREYLN